MKLYLSNNLQKFTNKYGWLSKVNAMSLTDLLINYKFLSAVILPLCLPTSPDIDPVSYKISCPRSYGIIACCVAEFLPALHELHTGLCPQTGPQDRPPQPPAVFP